MPMHMFGLWDARRIGASHGFCKSDAYTCQGITCVYERSETRLGRVLSINLWTTLPGGQGLPYPGACPSWYPPITLIPAQHWLQHWNFCSLSPPSSSPPLQLRKGGGVCGGGWSGGFGQGPGGRVAHPCKYPPLITPFLLPFSICKRNLVTFDAYLSF